MQVENFTKSPESPYVKTKYKIHLKTTESQSVPMLRQYMKFISKRLSVENSYRNLQYFVKVEMQKF